MSASTCTGTCVRSWGLPVAGEYRIVQRLERAGVWNWLLLAVATWALLLLLAAWSGMGGTLRDTPVLAADPLPPPAPVQPARIGPLAQYAEAAARPLFTQDRRPRSFIATNPEGETGPVQAQTLDFILTGVLISPQVQLATLQPTGGGATQRVRVGSSPEGASGWQLLSLEPRRATFAGNGSQLVLDLRTYGVAGIAEPPRMPEGGAPGESSATASPPVPIPVPVPVPVTGTPTAMGAGAAGIPVPSAPAQTADGAPPQTDQARIEAIRQRIEARRAQQRAASQNTGAPAPPKP